MRLVRNAKSAWRWFSVQVLAVLAAVPLIWHALPPEVTDTIPEWLRPWLLALVAIGGIVGRLIDQGATSDGTSGGTDRPHA